MFKNYLCMLFMGIFLLSGCSTLNPPLTSLANSPAYYNYLQDSFEQYLEISRDWLTQNREFISDDPELEIDMNAPFMLKAGQPTTKAVMLVHGLGDSPFYFRDLGHALAAQGFDVFVLLLPGHGSKPSDLLLPTYEDWQQIVDLYSTQLKQRYPELWLGGFSTGANLVTIHSLQQGGIAGLLLFSPGFQSHVPFIEKFSPFVATFLDWAWVTEEDNLARYSSAPLNATIAYSDSASRVRALLKHKQVETPSYVVMSEADSVIDPDAIIQLFNNRFTHPSNKMIFYGEAQMTHNNIEVLSMRLPDDRISTASHMSPLFSPDNPYFGRQGRKRMCRNGLNHFEKSYCEQGDDVWFSAWGYTESGKIHARLTWNPYFKEMIEQLQRFTMLVAKPDQHRSLSHQSERVTSPEKAVGAQIRTVSTSG